MICQEMYDNCPFKNGNGYGDGRALSIGELLVGGEDRLMLHHFFSLVFLLLNVFLKTFFLYDSRYSSSFLA